MFNLRLIGLFLFFFLFNLSLGYAEDGEKLFKSKSCAGCHSKSFDSFAPSLKTISKSYRDKKVELINFLQGKSPGLIYKEPKTMKNIVNNITKKLTPEELEALTNYLLSY